MLGVSDVDGAAKFYRETLGLTMHGRFEDFAFFGAGGVTLALSGDLARRTPSPCEACEFVFGVSSVGETYRALRDRVTFVNEPRQVNAENWAVAFHDLDGHLLSFYGPQ
jgi:catechol 2,3-dioxygenase-like lactoylglutathione lyase family enzyme